MAEGKQREAWNHTSDLMAHLANLQRVEKSDAICERADFHPFLRAPAAAPPVRVSDPRELARMEGFKFEDPRGGKG